jgi:hypothetical protein
MDKRAAKIRKMTEEVSTGTVGRFVTIPARKKANPPYRRGKTRRMTEPVGDESGVGIRDADGTEPADRALNQSIESEPSPALEPSPIPEEKNYADTTDLIDTDDRDDIDWIHTGSESLPTESVPSPDPAPWSEPTEERVPQPPSRFDQITISLKTAARRKYEDAGGAKGIARSALAVTKEGLQAKEIDVTALSSDEKDELARIYGGYGGKSDTEITASLEQADREVAQYKNSFATKRDALAQAELTVREKSDMAFKAKLERDRHLREYNGLVNSYNKMKPGPEKERLDLTIEAKKEDYLKAEAEYTEKEADKQREDRNLTKIRSDIDTIERKIASASSERGKLQAEKNLLTTALYRGLASKKKEDVGVYKKFKREMTDRGKSMTGMGNLLSQSGVTWNDKLLAKPGAGAADGLGRMVGKNVGYHPSRSVTDVVVGSSNAHRNRALVDSLTSISAGRSVTPLGVPGSVHEGIGRRIQPTVRPGQVQAPQLAAPRLGVATPGSGGRLTVNMPDVRTPFAPAPQPVQATTPMPRVDDFEQEAAKTFRKANNSLKFVFGDRKPNKGKRKHI